MQKKIVIDCMILCSYLSGGLRLFGKTMVGFEIGYGLKISRKVQERYPGIIFFKDLLIK